MNHERSCNSQIASMGAIGCYLSHVNIWQQLMNDSEHEMYVVFEDDCDRPNVSVEVINQQVNDTIKQFPDWDIIYLGDLPLLSIFYPQQKVGNNEIFKVTSMIYGTHAYLINKKGASKLLSKAFPIVFQVDSYMSYQYLNGSLNAYKPYKQNLISQGITTKSSIQTDTITNIKPLLELVSSKWICGFIFLSFVCIIFTMYNGFRMMSKQRKK